MILHTKLPKTGTTTIDKFAKDNIDPEKFCSVDRHNEKHFDLMSNDKIKKFVYITGHRLTKKRIERIKKIAPKVFTFIVFRLPSKRVLSAYNYDVRPNKGLYQFKNFPLPFFIWNFLFNPANSQISWIIRRYNEEFLKSFSRKFCTEKYVKEITKDFDLILTTDSIDEFIPKIFFKIGITKEIKKIKRRNVAGSTSKKTMNFTKNFEKKMNRKNKEDLKFFNHVNKYYIENLPKLIDSIKFHYK